MVQNPEINHSVLLAKTPRLKHVAGDQPMPRPKRGANPNINVSVVDWNAPSKNKPKSSSIPDSISEPLIENWSRFIQVLDMLFDGILIIQDGLITKTNQGFLSMTGYAAEEIIGRKMSDLDGWKELDLTLAKVVSKQSESFETVVPRKYSLPVSATVRALRLLNGTSSVIFAVIAGMTENEPASANLLRSAERYRSLFESVQDLIFTKDKDLKFSDVNPAMGNTFGLLPSEIVGRTSEQIYGHEVGTRIRKWDMRVLSGETIEDEHAVVVRGERLIFHDIRVPIRNSAGNIVGVCGICRNVTERRPPEPKQSIYSYGYRSEAMKDTMELAAQAASKDSILLLQGESGSGKDHLAQWIHDHSKRSGSRFLTINCATVPHELAESELFGHESGAFTGAASRKRGLLELAEGGTLLLNEIGELSPSLQSKLLVFLDTKSFHRLGGERNVHVDARIVAATHRDLEEEVTTGRFSKALFYRLNVFPILVPPLRNRTEDLPMLSRELIVKVAMEMNLSGIPGLNRETLKELTLYDWPGNVRELRNVIEKGLILWQSGRLKLNVPSPALTTQDSYLRVDLTPGTNLSELTKGVVRSICVEAIRRNAGNRSAAARSIGISRDSLYRHLRNDSECDERNHRN
jgi:PAS domain S-box-containing protein